MITLKDFMEAINYRITAGDAYLWDCYGPNAYTLDSWNGDHNGYSVSVTFDTVDQLVYEMSVCDYKNNRAYRLINPEYIQSFKDECLSKDIDDVAWDFVPWIELEEAADLLDKTQKIVNGLEYDVRVSVPVELDDETFHHLALEAHSRDVTINQLVEILLTKEIEKRNGNT
jgi:hypothetical protein